MKAGYKKNRKKASKKQKGSDPALEAAAPEVAMDVDGVAEGEKRVSAKALRRKAMQGKKSLKAKAVALKTTTAKVRKGLQRGVQGATNLTINKLQQHVLKTHQDRSNPHGGAKPAVAVKAAAAGADVQMAL